MRAGRGVVLESSAMRNRPARAPLCSRSPFSPRAAGKRVFWNRTVSGLAPRPVGSRRRKAAPPPPRPAPLARERRALPGPRPGLPAAQAGELAGRIFRGWLRPGRPPTPERVRAPPQGAHPERPRNCATGQDRAGYFRHWLTVYVRKTQ